MVPTEEQISKDDNFIKSEQRGQESVQDENSVRDADSHRMSENNIQLQSDSLQVPNMEVNPDGNEGEQNQAQRLPQNNIERPRNSQNIGSGSCPH